MLPANFDNLYRAGMGVRRERVGSLSAMPDICHHLKLIESMMDAVDVFRQEGSGEGDVLIVQLLGLRAFNSCAVALNLSLEGYYQAGGSVARDLMETAFLLELFATDPLLIAEWKALDASAQYKRFSPAKVRDLLENKQGYATPQRAIRYKILSQMAGHPSAQSDQMLRAAANALAVVGPFKSDRLFRAIVEELAYISVVAGASVCQFMPDTGLCNATRASFAETVDLWAKLYTSPLVASGTVASGSQDPIP